MATKTPSDFDSFVRDRDETRATETIERAGSKVKLRREHRGNVEVLTAESTSIKTVAELLTAAGVPLTALERDGDSEFVVERSKANKYDQIFGAGPSDDRQPIIVPLWQVWAELRRRKMAAVEWEPVRPVEFQLPRGSAKPAPRRSLKCALILPDSQHGFARRGVTLDPLHDRRAVDVMLQLARLLVPDRIVLLGDMLDLPEWSDKFLHGPEFAHTTQASAIDLAWCIAQLRAAAPAAKMDYISGNHENRLTRAILKNAIAAVGLAPVNDLDGAPLLSIPRLLGLDDLGVTYHDNYPSGQLWLNDNIRVTHGHIARAGIGDTSKAILSDARNSEIFGHLHHTELVAKTAHPMRGAVTYYACCPGTLARIDGAVPAATPRVNWQQGGLVVWYEEGNGLYQFVPVPIFGGRGIYDGAIIEGRDYAEQLARDTKRTEFKVAA